MAVLDDLADEIAALLHAPCTIESLDFDLLAFSGQGDAVDEVRRRSILERGSTPEVRAWFDAQGIRAATAPVRIPGDAARGIVTRLLVPAVHLGRAQAYVWLLDPDAAIDPALWPEAARLAESVGRLLHLMERRQDHRDELYRAVVEGTPQTAAEAAADLAAAAGLRLDEPVRCVVVERPALAEQLASRPPRPGVVWVRELEGASTAVVRSGAVRLDAGVGGLLAGLGLGRRLPDVDAATRVGVGPSVGSLDDLARSRSGALVALRVASPTPSGALASWDELGPLALLGVARADELRRTVLPPTVARLTAEAPDLARTARVFLDAAGNVVTTAAELGVHRQTVYHRLRQVEERTGLRLDDGADRLRLHLALTLAPFLG